MGCDETRAVNFVQNVLRFTKDEISLSSTNKLKFLQIYVDKFYQNEVFTNFNSHYWNVKKIDKNGFNSDLIPIDGLLDQLEKKRGGACFVSSYGSSVILTQFGFNCYVTWTFTENRPGFENGHFMMVAKDVDQPGDVYLVDFGTRISPLSQPIPLHTLTSEGQESDLYYSYYMYNKFVRKGDEILRFTGKVGSEDRPFLFYRVKSVPLRSDLEADDGHNLRFSKFPRLPEKTRQTAKERPGNFWFANFMMIGFPEGKTRVFRNTEFMYQLEKGGPVERKFLETSEELIQELLQSYPQFGEEDIRATIEAIWDKAIQPVKN